MREFLTAATGTTAGTSITSAATGQLTVAIISMIFMIMFGAIGLWLKWRDSKAIREALESGDLQTALKVRSK